MLQSCCLRLVEMLTKAKDYVNVIRRRAGIAELGAVTVDDVINERHLEFVGEGKRYFDLVRTGKAATVLVPDSYGYRTNSWTESKKVYPYRSGMSLTPTRLWFRTIIKTY